MITISNYVYIPSTVCVDNGVRIKDLQEALTFIPRVNAEADKVPQEIVMYKAEMVNAEMCIGVPVSYYYTSGLFRRVSNVQSINKQSIGTPIKVHAFPDANHKSVLYKEQQAKFMDDLLKGTEKYHRVIGCAPTGLGKTIVSLYVAGKLGRRTLIVVPLHKLADQWEKAIINVLGMSKEDVGYIYGKVNTAGDKPFVIAILKTLAARAEELKPKIWDKFGLVIYDEVHRVPTDSYNAAIGLTNAKYMIGLSATPKRKDKADCVINYHISTKFIQAEVPNLQLTVCMVPFKHREKLYGFKHGSIMKFLSLMYERNVLISVMGYFLYKKDRNTLIVSTSIAHLKMIFNLLVSRGVPANKIGLFTRTGFDGKVIKNSSLSEIEKDTSKKIILSTYTMFKEGVDIPRLDSGIDATPIASSIQLIGRIRRFLPGKKVPLWFSIEDKPLGNGAGRLAGYTKKRIEDYKKTDAKIIYTPASYFTGK